jgi:hypothetical protein
VDNWEKRGIPFRAVFEVPRVLKKYVLPPLVEVKLI